MGKSVKDFWDLRVGFVKVRHTKTMHPTLYKGKQALRGILRIFGLGFYTLVLMLGVGIFILILPLPHKRRANMMLVQFWSRLLCELFGLRIRTEGEPLPFQSGYLVVANHMSYIDIIALGSVIPGIFTAKSDVRFWPVLGLA